MAEETSIEQRLGEAIVGGEEPEAPVDETPTGSTTANDDDAPEPIDELTPEVEGEDEVEASESDDQEFIEAEIDGVTYEVPKMLESHILNAKDYTQKSQSLAAQRREVEFTQKQMEATKSEYEFAQSIQPELTQIAQCDAYLKEAEKIDWRSLESKEMMLTKVDIDRVEKLKRETVESLSTKQKEWQDAQEQAVKELLESGAAVLKDSIPGWNESKQEEMRSYALADGYSEQEIATVSDPRFVRTLWKAAQYDKLQEGAESAKVKLAQAPSIAGRGRQTPTAKDNKLKLRKSIDSAKGPKAKAKVIEQALGERFA